MNVNKMKKLNKKQLNKKAKKAVKTVNKKVDAALKKVPKKNRFPNRKRERIRWKSVRRVTGRWIFCIILQEQCI